MLQQRVTDTITWAANLAGEATVLRIDPFRVLQVLPQGVGWSVLGLGEPTYYLSGRSAEHAARTLALAIARHVGAVELRISDRSGHLAGRYLFEAPDTARPAAASVAYGRPRSGAPLAVVSHV